MRLGLLAAVRALRSVWPCYLVARLRHRPPVISVHHGVAACPGAFGESRVKLSLVSLPSPSVFRCAHVFFSSFHLPV